MAPMSKHRCAAYERAAGVDGFASENGSKPSRVRRYRNPQFQALGFAATPFARCNERRCEQPQAHESERTRLRHLGDRETRGELAVVVENWRAAVRLANARQQAGSVGVCAAEKRSAMITNGGVIVNGDYPP